MPGDDLAPAAVSRRLGTRFMGQRVIYYPRLDSTMAAARKEAREGAPEGTVVIAGEQTGGRGRLQRIWLSPPGNIALSVILYPEAASLPYLVMLAALGVVRSIEAVTGLTAQIKWPNDVLINGKKVCGILTGSEFKRDRLSYAVIGTGINVALRAADFPEIAATASSLNEEAGSQVSRLELVRRLLVEMEGLYLTLPDGEPVYRAWRERLVTLGKTVRVTSGSSRLEGVAESVDGDGALRLRQPDGTLARIVAGDVSLRDR